MKLGHRHLKMKKLGHRSLHKVSLGARHYQHGAKIGGRILKKVGKATGQQELVMAGEGVERSGKVAGKIGRVSQSLEKII